MMRFPRINLIYIFIFLFGAVIISRLVFLQIVQGELYRALAKGQQEIFQPISGRRGEIFFHDRDNLVLAAMNKRFKYCYLSPRNINDKEEVAKLIAPIFGIDEKGFLKEIKANKNRLFWLVERRISSEQAEKITKLNLRGVHLGEEWLRYYPYDKLGSDVLGFVNKDAEGRYGIEGYWNDILTGEEGWQKIAHGPFGRFLERSTDGLIRGADIVLTIDKNIQAQAEKLLLDFSTRFGFETAQIVVFEPSNGRLLALVDFPSFDPNEFQKQNNRFFKNKAIQTLYEPGSVFKAFTIAAALNEGKITPETTYVDEGFVLIKDQKIFNYARRAWGKKTMTEILEKSINTGVVFAQSKMSHNVFLDYLTRFGIFEKTGIGLQGEVYSENRKFREGWDINFATASFGHGIEMTLLQMARIYGVIANKGRFPRLHIIESVVRNGEIETLHAGNDLPQVILPETASQLTRMLVSVTENGYGRLARVHGYYIAGKTGTSQIPFSVLGINRAGYSDQTWQTFVGFAPAFDPRFVIAIKLDKPNSRTASESTTLIFRDLAKYILNYYQIPPNRDL